MITSKADYYTYLNADRKALGVSKQGFLKSWLAPNYILRFQEKLRRLEYYKNCNKGFLGILMYKVYRLRFRKYALKLGFSIPENVFGPGLAIVHYGTIVVSEHARIGKNCRIHPNVTIGASGGTTSAPTLGDNVYLGPGSKLFGDISIASNCAIGANATVSKSFTNSCMLIAGNPAKEVKEIAITSLIKHL